VQYVLPDDLVTTEGGRGFDFSARLGRQPTANVTLTLFSSNALEGSVSPTRVVFTPSTWFRPHLFSVRGLRDAAADGDQIYRYAPLIAVVFAQSFLIS
jgi:hypothetical protein